MITFPIDITQLNDLGRIAAALERLANVFAPQYHVEGAIIVYVLPNDQAPTLFTISLPVITDAEGESITDFTEEFVSTNPGVVSINLDTPGSVRSGNISYGTSGTATITYTVTVRGQIVKSVAKNFTITTGAVGNVAGGDLTLEGITEQPE